MRLQVFRASSGDCLLMTSNAGTRILIDGGMDDAYPKHIAPALGKLSKQGHKLDLLYVSHIDDDHIGGVLKLLDTELDWRAFDFQKDEGNTRAKEPGTPRAPEIAHIWHNAFHLQVNKNRGPIEDTLAASAALFEASPAPADIVEAARIREFVTGVTSALRVSHHVSEKQFNIPLNDHFDGKLAMAGERDDPIPIGSLKVTVIGPFPHHLSTLRTWWKDWVEDVENQGKIKTVKEQMADDAERLAHGEVQKFDEAIRERALEFSNRTTKRLTKIKGITEPNLASLMLYVEGDGKTVLLTGDGAGEDVVEGLERANILDEGKSIHVDVLKVQHHGATANVKEEFCRRVTADHYILCGNGDHGNPEPEVVQMLIDSRTDSRPFKLWFSSSLDSCGTPTREKTMGPVEELVAKAVESDPKRIRARFLRKPLSSFEVAP